MPSSLHETLVEMFLHRPELAAELLGALGIPLPDHERARLDQGDFTDLSPTQYRSDAVIVLTTGEQAVLAVVVEVQLRADRRKHWSWPVYVTTLRARLRCPTVLLVVCTDEATAAWCSTPIALGGPGCTLVPLVLGPDRVPVITDPAEAGRAPELAVLSAIAHGHDPERRRVLDAVVGAFAVIDDDHTVLYSDLVFAALPAAAIHYLEALMISPTYEFQSDFWRRRMAEVNERLARGHAEGHAEGVAEARADAVLAVLEARGIDVPPGVRHRIGTCSDLDLLGTWVRRAATVADVEDLFR